MTLKRKDTWKAITKTENLETGSSDISSASSTTSAIPELISIQERFISAYLLVLPFIFIVSIGGFCCGIASVLPVFVLRENTLMINPVIIINVWSIIKAISMQSIMDILPVLLCVTGKKIMKIILIRRQF